MHAATVILHYGDPALTMRLHAQLTAEKAEGVFVLDNAAPQAYPGAWQRTEKNLYWAGALEYSLAAFAAAGYSHVWFLNNDILFDGKAPHIARALGRLARMERTFGPVGVYAPSVPANPYHPQMVRQEDQQCRLVEYVDGIAPLINLACWRALGGVDIGNNPFGYGVDVWFSLCAHRAGWPVVVDHHVVVRHRYHSTARQISGFMEQAARAESCYLSARLGPDYREQIALAGRRWRECATL